MHPPRIIPNVTTCTCPFVSFISYPKGERELLVR